MSNAINDNYIARLFERLEGLEDVMTDSKYIESQQSLLRLVADGQLEEASEELIQLEQSYVYELKADRFADDDMVSIEAEFSDVY